jgi:hypothetical protein
LGKKDDSIGKQALARWEMICRPNMCGRLGIIDLGKKNDALLIKQLNKFYHKANVPWVNLVWQYYTNEVPRSSKLCGSFWWRDIMKLADMYREVCLVIWLFYGQISGVTNVYNINKYPRLFSLALDQKISVQDAIQT